MINESISQLQDSMLWGAAFAVIVLLLFLRRLRMTLAVMLAMPFSLMMAIIVLYFVGWSLNVITMMGIMICIGLVVDNSIVVVENIYRRAQQGDDRQTAAEVGASQVVLAITIATLTTVVVIVPLVVINDAAGFSFYMLRLGTPMVVGVLASLLVALTLIPLLTVRFTSSRTVQEPRIITRVTGWYRSTTAWVLDHRLDATLIMLVVVASAAFPLSKVAFVGEARGNIGNIEIDLDLPQNLSLTEAESLVARMEQAVYEYEQEWRIRTVTARLSPGDGELEIFLQPPERLSWWRYTWRNFAVGVLGHDPGAPRREEIMQLLPDILPEFPGVDYEIEVAGENESSDRLVRLMLYGDHTDQLLGHRRARRGTPARQTRDPERQLSPRARAGRVVGPHRP